MAQPSSQPTLSSGFGKNDNILFFSLVHSVVSEHMNYNQYALTVAAVRWKGMAAYHQVYDSRHLQADCQEPGSAPEPYAQQSSMGYLLYTYEDD